MARATHRDKHAIRAIVARAGERATPEQIRDGLGGVWTAARRGWLRKKLHDMVAQELLSKPSDGVYGLYPGWEEQSLDDWDLVARTIERLMRENGGRATTREIHAAFDDGHAEARDHIWQLVKRVLRHDGRFKRVGWG